MNVNRRFILPAVFALFLGEGTTLANAAAGGTAIGEGITHYYDFETSHYNAGETEFTIEGKSWDAEESDWKADGGITLHAHCGNETGGIGAPALKKTGFGNAFSGGGTGAGIFERSDARFLCPPTNGNWTIAFWALRQTGHAAHPTMLVNGARLPTVNVLNVTNASTDNAGFGFYALGGSKNNANCRVGVRLSEKTVSEGGAGADFTVRSIVSGGTLAWSKDEKNNTQENWHHILLVRDGTNLTLYLDGAAQGSAEMAEGSSVEVPEGGKLSTASQGGGQARGNALDDLAIWSRALGADEIALIATNGSPISRLVRPERIVWAAAGGSGDWSAAGNWDLGRWTDGLATVFPANAAGAAAGAVRVDTNAAVASLVFDGSYALEGAGGSIALGGPVTVAAGAVAELLAPVSGRLKKSGAGRLVYAPGAGAGCASCSFSGPVTVRGGTLASNVTLAADAEIAFEGAALRTALDGKGGAEAVFAGTNTLGEGASFLNFAAASFAPGSLTRIDGAVTLAGFGTVTAGGLGEVTAGEGAGLAVPRGAAFTYVCSIGTNLPAFTELGGTVTVTRCEMTPALIRSGAAAAVAKAGPGVGAEAVAAAFRGEISCAGASIPGVFSLGEGGIVTIRAAIDSDELSYTKREGAAEFTWNKREEAFDEGGTFSDFDNVSFLEGARPDQQVAVDVPERVLAGDVTVESGFLFTNRAINAAALTKRGGGTSVIRCEALVGGIDVAEGRLDAEGAVSAERIAVSNGAVFRAEMIGTNAIRFLRLTLTAPTGGEKTEGTAVSEFRLFREAPGGGYEKFEWPVGTRVMRENKECIYQGGSGTPSAAFTGNHVGNQLLSALIDGAYPGCGFANPYGQNNDFNKEWCGRDPHVITFEFPAAIPPPAGYGICLADAAWRHPNEWSIDVSSDGEAWTEAHSWKRASGKFGGGDSKKWVGAGGGGARSADLPAFSLPPAAPGVAPAEVAVAAGGTLVADGRWNANLTLEGGARLDARGEGAKLELAGAVSLAAGAAVEVDASGRALRNGEELVTWTGEAPEGTFTLVGCPGIVLRKTASGLVAAAVTGTVVTIIP